MLRAGHPTMLITCPREPLSPCTWCWRWGIRPCAGVGHRQRDEKPAAQRGVQENAASYVREGSMNLTSGRELFLYRDVPAHRACGAKDSDSSGGSSPTPPPAARPTAAEAVRSERSMFMNPYLSEKARGEIPRFLKWLRNAGLAFCVFCSFWWVVYPLSGPAGQGHLPRGEAGMLWIVVGAVPLVQFARNENAATMQNHCPWVENYSGPEVPLRWLPQQRWYGRKGHCMYF